MLSGAAPACRLERAALILLLAGLIWAGGCTAGGGSPMEGIEAAECIPAGQTAVSARVIQVADGDTITVRIGGEEYRLRYIGINAPELDSETQRRWAEQAREFNQQLVGGEEVQLFRDTSETDQYDRLLRYVIKEDLFVNYELVRRGMARARDYPPDTACGSVLAEAERTAREERLGIWSGQ